MQQIVDVDECGRTCFKQDCGCQIPPTDMISAPNPQYHYAPVPEKLPPIGPNYMRHWLQHPHIIPDERTSTLNSLPKKFGELAVNCSTMTTGWGIYFDEGFCWSSRGVFAMMAPVPASLLFGLVWSTVYNDIQGGFGAATYIFGLSMWMITWTALAVQEG